MLPQACIALQELLSLGHTPQPCRISALPATTSRPAQPCQISVLPAHTPRPAIPEIQTSMISILLGHTNKPCTALQDLCSARPHPQVLPHLRYKHTRSPFRWAMPPRPAQPCTIFTPQACAPKACQAGGPHKHDLHSDGLCPPSLSSQGSTDMQDLHSNSLHPSGTPSS
jgi:hypothetical protein